MRPRSALGLALLWLAAAPLSAQAVPAVSQPATPAAPCGPQNPFGPDHVCIQPYALCIAAPCVALPGNPRLAACACDVVDGASLGQAECSSRAPVAGRSGGQTLVSTYSFQQTLPRFKLLTCPASLDGQALRYADCYGMPCRVEPSDPAKAVCLCPVLEARGEGFITRGGTCDPQQCTRLWSGAPPAANTLVNWQLACDLGWPHPPEPFDCPR